MGRRSIRSQCFSRLQTYSPPRAQEFAAAQISLLKNAFLGQRCAGGGKTTSFMTILPARTAGRYDQGPGIIPARARPTAQAIPGTSSRQPACPRQRRGEAVLGVSHHVCIGHGPLEQLYEAWDNPPAHGHRRPRANP